VSILSFPLTRYLYRIEALRSPVHPVIAVVLRDKTKGTFPIHTFLNLTPRALQAKNSYSWFLYELRSADRLS